MESERCPMSNPAHPHTLSRQIGIDTEFDCYGCGRKKYCGREDFHYHCTSCEVEFHYCCHRFRFPKQMIHPYHLQHPLTLVYQNDESIISDKCSWCGDGMDTYFYHCFICNFSLDRFCFDVNNPPLTIKNPKSHHHPLFFFPRPFLLPCDACGSVDVKKPSYVCLQCNYMVHKSCIDLPRVIQITRHPHRLYHTPYLSPTNPTTLCRICYKTVDIKYGMYSCNLDDCSYVAHAKCATHRNVWDESELEWEPEESDDEAEAITSFTKVGDDLIKHFCHEHNLRFKKHDGVQVVEEQCQACTLPINSHDFYVCTDQCEFFLHEVCAHLPRKLNHALHIHPLVLDLSPLDNYKSSCSACSRNSSGFKYICGKGDCMFQGYFGLDVRCVLVPEYFTHKSHIHPLFISTSHGENDHFFCKACKKRCWPFHLQCTVCEFSMCYVCATIPDEVYYKFDKHPLLLCYGESKNEKYWCEVCEKEVDSSKWFYTCDKCCITIHRKCLFGSVIYMKYGCTFDHPHLGELDVVRNNGSTRPICYRCNQRCSDFIYFADFIGAFCCACFAGKNSRMPRQSRMIKYSDYF